MLSSCGHAQGSWPHLCAEQEQSPHPHPQTLPGSHQQASRDWKSLLDSLVTAQGLSHLSGGGGFQKKKKKKEKMYCVLTCQHLRQVNLLKYSAAAGATADKARPAARFTTEASTSPATRRAASQLLCFQYFKSDICFLIVFCAYASMQRGESTSVHPVLSRVIDFHFSNREIFFPWILCYYSCKKMTHAGKTPLPLIFFYNIPWTPIST